MRSLAILLLVNCALISFGQTSGNSNPLSVKPFVIGAILTLQSTELKEKRTINVYLPEGYSHRDTTRYPVVYLLDGSADEDFIHIVGLYQFNSFSWINRVPKSIVVGIANVDRRRDFTYPSKITAEQKKYPTTGKSDKFIRFLLQELQPLIDRKYKTNADRTIVGESLGGLLATEILLKKPEMFNRYLIISPSLWWDDGSILKTQSDLYQKKLSKKTDVYIGVGKEGPAPSEAPHLMETDARMLAQKLKDSGNVGLAVFFDYLPKENHATIMHQAVFNALRLLYPATKEN